MIVICIITLLVVYCLQYISITSFNVIKTTNTSHMSLELIEVFTKDIVFMEDLYSLVCEIFLNKEDYIFTVGDEEYFINKYILHCRL